jgi:hypothetical protein
MTKIVFCGGILTLASLVAGCSMIENYPISENNQTPAYQRPWQAQSQLSGTYFLAKHLLELTVTTGSGSTSIQAKTAAVPDRTAQIQVGFALSPLAEDNIEIQYQNGLLKQITATAVDKTGEIIVALAKDVGLFRAGKASSPLVKSLQFDPFDARQAERVNRELGRGNCVEVEIYDNQWSPGCGGYSMGQGVGMTTVDTAGDISTSAATPFTPGIYYRRSVPHRVHIVANGKTAELKNYLFANDGPVLRVDIDRTAFVTRETKVVFDGGELTSVVVKKESEALAVAKLPVQVFDAYVSGVTDALTQRKAVEDAKANLYNAQAGEIKARTALIKEQASSVDALGSGARSLSLGRSTAVANCYDAYGSPNECNTLDGGAGQ